MREQEKITTVSGGFKESWSIGIYTGDSPMHLQPGKDVPVPAISRHHITDMTASFVADPFMIRVGKTWYLFMEIMNEQTKLGVIGLVTSTDGQVWNYQQVILEEPYHLSYPFVFEHEDEYYMVPETIGAHAVRLYKAKKFPFEWEYITDLLKGQYADPTLFRYNNLWWLFAASNPYQNDTLNLFSANDLTGPYSEHPLSPIIKSDVRHARPAGRINNQDGKLIRLCQDCYPVYGFRVRAFEITALTINEYSEKELVESPILKASSEGKWNSRGMHHLDAHQAEEKKWMACVDGCYYPGTVLKKRAVWIFDSNYKLPVYLSVASFREHLDLPVTLVCLGKPEQVLMDVFKSLGGKIEFIIVDEKNQFANSKFEPHQSNRLLRMEIMGRWPEEQVILFDGDTIFSKKVEEFIPFINAGFKNADADKTLVGGIKEVDGLPNFYTAKRNHEGRLEYEPDEEVEQCFKDIYGDDWKIKLDSINFNNGVLVMYNCAELADAWKSNYLEGLKHPKVNPEDDQVPLSIAMYDLNIKSFEIEDIFNSQGKLSGDYAIYHAWNSKWKPELEKVIKGETNLEDYGIIAQKHFKKIPGHWLDKR